MHWGVGAKTFYIFMLTPESLDSMCLGVVRSTKFCMAAASECTIIGSHTKKVCVTTDHIYINAGKNSEFSDPHVPSMYMGPLLAAHLGELRPREDWLQIFQVLLDENDATLPMTKDVVTPKK
jgi:hypothetical protein